MHEVNFYLKGRGWTQIDGKKYDFVDGSVAIVPLNVQHDEQFLCTGDVLCIKFEFEDNSLFRTPALLNMEKENPVFVYANLLLKEALEKKEDYYSVCNHLLKILITEIQRTMFGNTDSGCNSLMAAKQYISENFYKHINFSKLASLSGYSYDYFRHFFKQQFGLSPQTYLILVRLENAHEILSSTPNISITAVADSCGFSDSSQFSTLFSRTYRISPRKFQKMSEQINIKNATPDGVTIQKER